MPLTITRSILVVFVPGIVAAAPWFLWIVQHFQSVSELYSKFPSAIAAVAFSAIVMFGTVVEGINSRIEVRWDREREAEWQVEKNWFDYLARAFDVEPAGYSYLSRKFTTLYFELAMMWAIPLAALGAILMLETAVAEPHGWAVAVGLGALIAAHFFWRFASDTHLVLCEARLEINERLGPVKAPLQSQPELRSVPTTASAEGPSR
jgi:hypothetical protein